MDASVHFFLGTHCVAASLVSQAVGQSNQSSPICFGGDRVGALFGTSPIIQAGEKANIIIKRACAEAVSRRRCVFFAVFNFA